MQCHVNNWLEAVLAQDPSATATNAEKESTGNVDHDRLMKPFSNGKFDLGVNLAEFGLSI